VSDDVIIQNGSYIETSPSIAGHTGAVWITAGGAITVSTQGERGVPSSIDSVAAAGFHAGDIVITAGRSITIRGPAHGCFEQSHLKSSLWWWAIGGCHIDGTHPTH
jgi:hypothetical protein